MPPEILSKSVFQSWLDLRSKEDYVHKEVFSEYEDKIEIKPTRQSRLISAEISFIFLCVGLLLLFLMSWANEQPSFYIACCLKTLLFFITIAVLAFSSAIFIISILGERTVFSNYEMKEYIGFIRTKKIHISNMTATIRPVGDRYYGRSTGKKPHYIIYIRYWQSGSLPMSEFRLISYNEKELAEKAAKAINDYRQSYFDTMRDNKLKDKSDLPT